MIFVAVGTQKFQFNRLLQLIDRLIAQAIIKEEVFAQIGNSDYEPQHYIFQKFLNKADFESMVKQCDILITHSGVATIIMGLKYEKKVIVVPRLEKFNEHVDDHQVQIAQSFSQQNLAMMCNEKDDLGKLIKEIKSHKFAEYKSQRKLMLKTIRDYLKSI